MSLVLAPVQMLDYAVVEQTYVRHIPDTDPETAAVQNVQLNVSGQRDLSGVNLLLDVHANPPDENPDGAVYAQEGRVRVAGRFRWIGAESPSDQEQLLVVNGVSFLYGIARVYLAQASSGAAGPRMMLPSFSFRDIEVVLEDPKVEAEGEG